MSAYGRVLLTWAGVAVLVLLCGQFANALSMKDVVVEVNEASRMTPHNKTTVVCVGGEVDLGASVLVPGSQIERVWAKITRGDEEMEVHLSPGPMTDGYRRYTGVWHAEANAGDRRKTYSIRICARDTEGTQKCSSPKNISVTMDLPPRLAKAEAVPKRLLPGQPGPILIKAHLVDNDGTPVDDASVKAVLRKTGAWTISRCLCRGPTRTSGLPTSAPGIRHTMTAPVISGSTSSYSGWTRPARAALPAPSRAS